MLHAALLWFLIAAFFGAGLFNAIGTTGTKSDFVRWAYPAWWCRVTGGLEMATALLIALRPKRIAAVSAAKPRVYEHGGGTG